MKTGSTPSANHVESIPILKELQFTMPNLTEDQYIQILVAWNPKPVALLANAASVRSLNLHQVCNQLLPIARLLIVGQLTILLPFRNY